MLDVEIVEVKIRNLVSDLLFDDATERTSAHCFIVAFFNQVVLCFIGYGQINTFLGKGLVDVIQHQLNDVFEIVLREVREFNDGVETIEKFRAEVRGETFHDIFVLLVVSCQAFVAEPCI